MTNSTKKMILDSPQVDWEEVRRLREALRKKLLSCSLEGKEKAELIEAIGAYTRVLRGEVLRMQLVTNEGKT